MQKYEAMIFDLDGTLLNTLEDLAESVNHALGAMHFPVRSLAEIRAFVGNGVARLIQLAVPAGTDPALTERCLALFRAHYKTHSQEKTAPYPGMPELLERLTAGGYRTAVVSNKYDGAVKELCAHYFGAGVQAALGEREGVAKKPAPDMVLRALEMLGVPAARAVYVGDSEVDLQTARNAGLPCISVTWGFRTRAVLTAAGAELLVDSAEALARALDVL